MSDLHSTLAITCNGDLPESKVWVDTVVEIGPYDGKTTTTITSLGTFDENAKDGEIRMMVVEELGVTNSTGDRAAASEDCTHLAVAFPPIQQGSNIKCDVSGDSCDIVDAVD
jgi:hypothetical protein